ncbi:hypothetical protein JCM9957A_23470 [Kineosporia succinea]
MTQLGAPSARAARMDFGAAATGAAAAGTAIAPGTVGAMVQSVGLNAVIATGSALLAGDAC